MITVVHLRGGGVFEMITWTFLSWKTTKNWNSIWIYKKYVTEKLRLSNLFVAFFKYLLILWSFLLHLKVKNVKEITVRPQTFAKTVLAGNSNSLVTRTDSAVRIFVSFFTKVPHQIEHLMLYLASWIDILEIPSNFQSLEFHCDDY